MRLSSVSIVLLVLFVVNSGVDAIINKILKGAKTAVNKIVDNVDNLNIKVVGTLVNQVCDHSIKTAVLVGKGFDTVKCDSDHSTQEYCKVVDNFEMVMTLICSTVEEQRRELISTLLGCIKIKNKPDHGQSCMKKFYDILMTIPNAVQMIADAGK